MENNNYVNESDIREISDSRKTANLIKEALKIVDKLATYDIDDMSSYDKETLEDLIEKAKKMKKDRLWKLT